VQLNKLTVATLKAFLESVGVKPEGKKADIMKQVETHFAA